MTQRSPLSYSFSPFLTNLSFVDSLSPQSNSSEPPMLTSSPGPPPPPPPRKAPGMEQRQAACTHTSMTRLYDIYGSYKCQMCHRHPSMGYLYQCTQDHDGVLPDFPFHSTTPPLISFRTSDDPVSHQLSASIMEGIMTGQYTAHQIQILWEQKQGVRNAIIAQEERAAAGCPSSSSSEDSDSTSSSDLENLTMLTKGFPDESTDSSASSNESSVKTGQMTSTAASSADGAVDMGTKETVYEALSPPCTWKCCQTCRPTYRDRAYQSLNAIMVKPSVKAPPAWEFENRRISDPKVVAALGLPKLRHIYHTYDDLREARSELGQPSESLFTESEYDMFGALGNGVTLRRRRSGFRETVKKALGGLATKNNSTSDLGKTSGKNLSQESFRRFSRSMLFKRRPVGKGSLGGVVDDDQLQESLTLMVAKNTPLPVDELEGGEVAVEDGVAVTEEGVDMAAADIIMQV